jgi:hypothetical protein
LTLWYKCHECPHAYKFDYLATHAREHGSTHFTVDFMASVQKLGSILI